MSQPIEQVSGDSLLLQEFIKRFNKAKGVADLWMALHQACYFYAIPSRNKYWKPREQQGDMRGARVYDTTAIEATKTFVSKLHTAMTPPGTQWGYLTLDARYSTTDEQEREEYQMVLDEYMKKLFDFIHESNFDVVINECYFDLSIGTACLVVNSYTDEQPLMFTSVPMDTLAVEEAMTGRLESWYRDWQDVKICEIKIRWPKAKIPAYMMQMMKQDSQSVIQEIYEGVMYKPKEPKPYCYVVCTASEILWSEYFDINPGIVWRFQKVNNDIYGRGPIMDALPSIISLNEVMRIELASANLNVFRPYMAFSDAVFNPHTFKMQPMTVIPIAPIGTNGQPPLIPLGDASNVQFAQVTIQDLRMQIRSLLFADSPVPQDSVQPATATELMINQQMLAQRIGPLFSRLQQEFLYPLIERVSYILDKMGLLPRPQIKGAKLVFRYKSPLQLAKGQEQIARFTQFYQLLQGIFGPQMAQVYINPETAPWEIASLMQLDLNFLNTPEGVAQAMQQLQNQVSDQQDQMEAAGMPTIME